MGGAYTRMLYSCLKHDNKLSCAYASKFTLQKWACWTVCQTALQTDAALKTSPASSRQSKIATYCRTVSWQCDGDERPRAASMLHMSLFEYAR